MARIRSIHPGIWTDEAFVSVSRDARLLFIGILNECDDQGAFEWKPLQIKMRLTAGDDASVATISSWLAELASTNLVRKYEVKGTCFGAVRNFCHWQRPKKPNSVHPMPVELRIYAGPKDKSSEPTQFNSDDGSELSDHELPSVPNQLPTGGENPSQMEEIKGGDEGRRIEDSGSLRSPVVRPPDDDPQFCEFWKLYPRKEAKQDAWKAWRGALKAASAEEILAGLLAYPFSPDRTFWKLPAGWLRTRRWEGQAFTTPPTTEVAAGSLQPRDDIWTTVMAEMNGQPSHQTQPHDLEMTLDDDGHYAIPG